MRISLLATAVAVLAAICAPLAIGAKDDLILISRGSDADGGVAADSSSFEPSVSADGRYVAFRSAADNLSTVDVASADIFVRDTQTGTTTLVSRQSAADGGAGADADSGSPSISADGRYVAFESGANNLSDEDIEGVQDIFVRDTQANTTTLVSRQSAADGGAGAMDRSEQPSISAEGRYVAFQSDADNLSTDDDNSFENVFVRDTQANTTTLVSRASGESGAAGDGGSRLASISADGRYVAFTSEAENLSTDAVGVLDVFVRDTQANTTTLVSRQSAADGGAGGDDESAIPSISADGRYVAFRSTADNLSAADDDAVLDIFVRDTQANTTTLVSRQSASDGGAGGDDGSDRPSISSDGRYVAFESEAENLSDADGFFVDVFVRDTQENTTTLVSRASGADGAAGTGDSEEPSVSADGRFAAFRSPAKNLSSIDGDETVDIFMRDLLGGPETPAPAPAAPNSDTTPPGLGGSRAKSPQKLGKPIKVKVVSDEDAAVTVTATAKPQGKADKAKASKTKAVKFKAATAQVRVGTPVTLTLKLTKAAAAKLKAAAKAKAKIGITATDSAGNRADKQLTVRLR